MFHRILVALDGSPLDEVTLRRAAEFALRDDAELVLLRAAAWPAGVHTGVEAAPEPLLHSLDVADVRAGTYLHGVAKRLRRCGHEVRWRMAFDPPARALCQAAREEAADLILMATHRRHPLARLLLGSVSADVSRRAPCPVMVLHEAQA